jgi:hypothetical protein
VLAREARLAPAAALDEVFSPDYARIIGRLGAVPRLVVLGPPGAGMTTLCKDLNRRMLLSGRRALRFSVSE